MREQSVPGGQPSWIVRNGIGLLLLIVAMLVSLTFFIHYPITERPRPDGKATQRSTTPIGMDNRTLGDRLFGQFTTLPRHR
ncbi:MAG TPA: hypothetical protein VK644_15665 [Chitinophagaceae bacterium]|nr:hypothetical protein [Chitinophagaceae bacterium]